MFGFFGNVLKKILGGSRNERIIRTRMKIVTDEMNPLEPQMRALSDEELLQRSQQLKRRRSEGESRRAVLPEAFALVREASRRARNHRQFDVQLAAGLILDEGWIAEEATGEGKTIACYPAIYMAVLDGMHAHVITVNEYLVQRDAEFAKPIFEMLGVTVGFIISNRSMDAATKKQMYACDITYGTNSEFGFDYLRDNMELSVDAQVQGPLDFAIVDEVDSILVDDARTPLIISGPAVGQTEKFSRADAVAREVIARQRPWEQANTRVENLRRELAALGGERGKAKGDAAENVARQIEQAEGQLDEAEHALAATTKYYETERDKKAVHMTHEGVGAAQDIAGVGSFYVGGNMEWPHLMDQALRGHLVYEKDVDYVVQNGQVIIVDQSTGRLMEGREWSDGLHQAVEAKERVKVKEENQTLATITLQNFFKLYKKLAGMTGTAMTEAEEFMKIYKLDVAAVPTHRPINRMDYNDRIYAAIDGKFDALVEEINTVSKAGRPVLVGTTSVEKSEKLSEMLTRRYGIRHEVLNARPENARREADIVAQAGFQSPLKPESKEMVGNVTVATNMAGRGTDIKLGAGVVYEKCRVPSDDEVRAMGFEPDVLYPAGVNKCCMVCDQHDPATNCAHCFKPKVDDDFPLRGRVECPKDVPCGLHIVGTERHEARRIDNQLRGRSGRQGDPGSSRFFLSLRDELMAIFAGEWAVKVLGWLGLQGDMAIEDKRISNGIARAQRKVEERNFEIRKQLLESDEVMDHQRKAFYGRRQQVLEGRDLRSVVQDMLTDSVRLAVGDYLEGDHVRRSIAEWARTLLQAPIDPEDIRAKDADDWPELERDLRNRAKDEAAHTVTTTLGEYMAEDAEPGEWDLKGLSSWAMSRFGVNLSQNHLRKMTPHEVEAQLTEAAFARIDEIDLSSASQYLRPGYEIDALAEWARSKFGIDMTADELSVEAEVTEDVLLEKVRRAYEQRETDYPVEQALDDTIGHAGSENVYAAGALADWVNRKFGASLTADDIRGRKIADLHVTLTDQARHARDEDVLRRRIASALGSAPSVDQAVEFARTAFDTVLAPESFDGDVTGQLIETGRQFLRREMSQLERYVLLQIYDSSWKDHLLAMDHLRDAINLRAYAQEDPRVAYKREGARMFEQMLDGVGEKISDIILKVRLAAGQEMSSVYQITDLAHEETSIYDAIARGAAGRQGQAGPQGPDQQRVETIRRDVQKVGRNDPCPCGSGKKYKKCCGKEA